MRKLKNQNNDIHFYVLGAFYGIQPRNTLCGLIQDGTITGTLIRDMYLTHPRVCKTCVNEYLSSTIINTLEEEL